MPTSERPILIVDDDHDLRLTLAEQLGLEGEFTAVEAATLQEAEALLSAADARFDLVILDITMPDGDGRDFCAKMRQLGHKMPVIMLTGSDAENDVVRGLDAGANDYIAKPFRLAELLARVRALLRRGNAETSTVQGVRVDPDARRAWLGDTELELTTKEFDLLCVLVNDAGKVVTREQIMREVWDSKWWGSTKTLDMHISWLRRKLGDDAHSPRYITTVRGVGFRFERGD